eukprot:1774334-Prymnesium_polylepis.1
MIDCSIVPGGLGELSLSLSLPGLGFFPAGEPRRTAGDHFPDKSGQPARQQRNECGWDFDSDLRAACTE